MPAVVLDLRRKCAVPVPLRQRELLRDDRVLQVEQLELADLLFVGPRVDAAAELDGESARDQRRDVGAAKFAARRETWCAMVGIPTGIGVSLLT